MVAATPVTDWKVRVRELDGSGALISVQGELDLSNRDRLAAVIEETAARTVGYVILDLGDLGFCDAAGLEVMAAAHHDLAHAGRRLVIINATRHFCRLVNLVEAGFLLDAPLIRPSRA